MDRVDVAELDLTSAPAGAVMLDGSRVAVEDLPAACRPTHGLTDAEVEEVRARRALQGPNERRVWAWLAWHHLTRREPKGGK